MEAFEVLSNLKNWSYYNFKGYTLSKIEAETCIEALDRATRHRSLEGHMCPRCKAECKGHNYCPECGQAILWRD